MSPSPVTYTATTKGGHSFPVECRPEPKYLSTEYEAVAYVAGKKARVFIGPEGRPAVELTAALVKEILGKELPPKHLASVALDRPYQQENEAMVAAANAALHQQAAELLASLPAETLVHPWESAGSMGMHYYVRIDGVSNQKQGLVADLLEEQVSKQVKSLRLHYHLSEGCEATFEAAPLTLREIQQKAAAAETAQQQKQQAEKQRRQQVEQQELFVWDADQIYSSAGNQMLHSLGGMFSRKDKYVGLYTTGYSRDIPQANTTYSLRSELAAAGLVFDKESKQWRLPYSDEAATTVLDLLRKYDTKAWPADLGLARCWECGCYSRHLDSDGYCGC